MKMTNDGVRFKSPSELRAEFHSVGLRPSDDIIVTCFKGARASNTALALKEAGYTKVRVYLGSWNEWSRDLQRPIDEGDLTQIWNEWPEGEPVQHQARQAA